MNFFAAFFFTYFVVHLFLIAFLLVRGQKLQSSRLVVTNQLNVDCNKLSFVWNTFHLQSSLYVIKETRLKKKNFPAIFLCIVKLNSIKTCEVLLWYENSVCTVFKSLVQIKTILKIFAPHYRYTKWNRYTKWKT